MRFLDVLRSRLKTDEKEIECPVYNPLGLSFTSLLEIDYSKEQRPFAFEEYTRDIFGSKALFTDYLFKDGDSFFKLRVLDDKILLLWHFDQFGYSDDFHKIMQDTEESKQFEVTEDDGTVIPYIRLNNMDHAWEALVRKLTDADGNGKITKSDPVEEISLKYWDFYKEDTKHTFLFVELNETDGMFTLWNGLEINPDALNIL